MGAGGVRGSKVLLSATETGAFSQRPSGAKVGTVVAAFRWSTAMNTTVAAMMASRAILMFSFIWLCFGCVAQK